jgi:hypothetical protein
MQALSPAIQALVGTYVAVAGPSDGEVRHVLSLGADATATLRTMSPDGKHELSAESGAWIADGPTIQVVLADPSDPAALTTLVLKKEDGSLVASGLEGRRSRFAGLAFARTESEGLGPH